MTDSAKPEGMEQGWDAPWYRFRTDRFEAAFLPEPDEDLEAVCDVDVDVRLADGSRWTATVFTVAEVARLMEERAQTGENLGGRYFWCSDGLIVRDPGIENMAQVLAGLIDSGEYRHVLQRCDDE
ncbi:hypothetical protein BU52_08930 [Streptomyces toyocaensis]|uniref:Uncharacterized protein n=1 Tax=Streptomyces toyocaensis TaxID=55952 RepID=A0A081XVK7_STRTO|nr:hypothetical protein [Streptomyces toyocaensis]KES07580.1 hypothetical protein BU52_08930 [Streptomyces toyocaensis]